MADAADAPPVHRLDSKTASELFGATKKKKAKKLAVAEPQPESAPIVPAFDYSFLLQRISSLIRDKNPELQESRRYVIKPPLVSRVGTRRVAWTNFQMLCQMMRRKPDHVFQFVLSELGTEGSISGEGQLILKGRYNTTNIETLLRKYITEYVTCIMCKSPQTELQRDQRTRLYTMQCNACGAQRSVNTIKSGFHAISRADRRRAKAAT